MNKFRLQQLGRTANYNTFDRIIKNYIESGGVLVNCYQLLGSYNSKNEFMPLEEYIAGDTIFNENAKRKYSKETFELYGVTTMSAPNLAFGLEGWSLLDADELTFSFHYNTMVERLGRKFVIGDVLEMTFMRDIDVLGQEGGVNKFYTITSSMRDEKGWAANYKYHLWKIKCKPMPNSPEYAELLNMNDDPNFYNKGNSIYGGGGYTEDNTLYDNEIKTNDINMDLAEEDVSFLWHDEHHIYLDRNTEFLDDGVKISWGIDGIPNEKNCQDIPFGEEFPTEISGTYKEILREKKFNDKDVLIEHNLNTLNLNITVKKNRNMIIPTDMEIIDENNIRLNFDNYDMENIKGSKLTVQGKIPVGEYFLRIDTEEPLLFKRVENEFGQGYWHKMEYDWREKWSGTPAKLRKVINNDNEITLANGETQKIRQSIKQVARARVKKEHNNPRPWDKIGIIKG